jgi:hypothetical protein
MEEPLTTQRPGPGTARPEATNTFCPTLKQTGVPNCENYILTDVVPTKL